MFHSNCAQLQYTPCKYKYKSEDTAIDFLLIFLGIKYEQTKLSRPF